MGYSWNIFWWKSLSVNWVKLQLFTFGKLCCFLIFTFLVFSAQAILASARIWQSYVGSFSGKWWCMFIYHVSSSVFKASIQAFVIDTLLSVLIIIVIGKNLLIAHYMKNTCAILKHSSVDFVLTSAVACCLVLSALLPCSCKDKVCSWHTTAFSENFPRIGMYKIDFSLV